MTHLIDPPAQVTLPVTKSDQTFPVGRIFCVGRNYAAHAREMGHDPDREAPFFFMKPADTLIKGHSCSVPYPPCTRDLHHEVELVLALGSGGRAIAVDQALDHVIGAAVGLDLTRRDLQGEAKKAGRPWDMGKGFDGCAVVAPLALKPNLKTLEHASINLTVNGTIRQSGTILMMIWSMAEIISELSTYLTLKPGDLIFTGTPDGVAALSPGDHLNAQIADLPALDVMIEQPL